MKRNEGLEWEWGAGCRCERYYQGRTDGTLQLIKSRYKKKGRANNHSEITILYEWKNDGITKRTIEIRRWVMFWEKYEVNLCDILSVRSWHLGRAL